MTLWAKPKRRGEEPSVAEYVERYPELGEDIRRVFRAIAMMELLKPGSDQSIGPIAPVLRGGRDTIPDRLGDFRILRFVAEGGMGYVFEAEQESRDLLAVRQELARTGLDWELLSDSAPGSGRRVEPRRVIVDLGRSREDRPTRMPKRTPDR
jgi:hypothetical protein